MRINKPRLRSKGHIFIFSYFTLLLDGWMRMRMDCPPVIYSFVGRIHSFAYFEYKVLCGGPMLQRKKSRRDEEQQKSLASGEFTAFVAPSDLNNVVFLPDNKCIVLYGLLPELYSTSLMMTEIPSLSLQKKKNKLEGVRSSPVVSRKLL